MVAGAYWESTKLMDAATTFMLEELEKRLKCQALDVDEETGCWLWTGSISNGGYGVTKWKGRTKSVHRIVHRIWNGDIPEGYVIKHSCDVRHCINPAHLSMGTQRENLEEMWARGRANPATGERNGRHTKPECTARGERKGNNKLVEADVLAIRASVSEGMSHREVASKYDVGHTIIGKIARGEDWPHVGGPRTSGGSRRGTPKSLTDLDVLEIVGRKAKGEKVLALANEFGVSNVTIYNYLKAFSAK